MILAGKMVFKRCGMDYQKEPALSMVYLLASLYVFLFTIIRHRTTICFRSRLCKHPGYRTIFGLQTYRLRNQMMSCSRSSYPSQWFFKAPRSPSVMQKPAKMLPTEILLACSEIWGIADVLLSLLNLKHQVVE